jgi:hypothetical protein
LDPNAAAPASAACQAALPPSWRANSFRGHYPQLSAEDRPIWTRFLDAHADTFDRYAYDVPVGGQDCDQLDASEALKRQWRYCTAKRIDVLAQRGNTFTLIECRYQAGVSAVGALLVYRFLFTEHNPLLPTPNLLLLTDHIAPDTRRAAEHYGITVRTFPP